MLRWFTSGSDDSKKNNTYKELSFEEFREKKSELAKRQYVSIEKQELVVKFLRHVVNGEQKEAEAMAKADPSLITQEGNITDLSGRKFYNITAFKYALWAMDRHMWERLLPHMKIMDVGLQLKEMEVSGVEYCIKLNEDGVEKRIVENQDTTLPQLVKALQSLIEASQSGYSYQFGEQLRNVRKIQSLLPAHVVNEYLRADRRFYPTPHFLENVLPRNIIFYNYHYWPSVFNTGGNWYTMPVNYAFFRGDHVEGQWVHDSFEITTRDIKLDIDALTKLYEQRKNEMTLINSWVEECTQSRLKFMASTVPAPTAPPMEDLKKPDFSQYPKLAQCSVDLQKYVRSFSDKVKFSEQIMQLQLTKEEEEKLNKFVDPIITDDYIDIPVVLNKRTYNLDTVLKIERDPLTRENINLLNIQENAQFAVEFEEAINKIKSDRIHQNKDESRSCSYPKL